MHGLGKWAILSLWYLYGSDELPVNQSPLPHFLGVVNGGLLPVEDEGCVALRDLVSELGQKQVLEQSLVLATLPTNMARKRGLKFLS